MGASCAPANGARAQPRQARLPGHRVWTAGVDRACRGPRGHGTRAHARDEHGGAGNSRFDSPVRCRTNPGPLSAVHRDDRVRRMQPCPHGGDHAQHPAVARRAGPQVAGLSRHHHVSARAVPGAVARRSMASEACQAGRGQPLRRVSGDADFRSGTRARSDSILWRSNGFPTRSRIETSFGSRPVMSRFR